MTAKEYLETLPKDAYAGSYEQTIKSMEGYAKHIALAFYEYVESVPPEDMEGEFDSFLKKEQCATSLKQ